MMSLGNSSVDFKKLAYGNKGEDLSMIPRRKLLKIGMAMCTYNPGIREVETMDFYLGISGKPDCLNQRALVQQEVHFIKK